MLFERINEDWKKALKNKDNLAKETLSCLKAVIKNAEIENKGPITDNSVVGIINKEINKRKDAAEAFKLAGRIESYEKELKESNILVSYLPEQLNEGDLSKLIRDILDTYGFKGIKSMKEAMKITIETVKGRADNKTISAILKQNLQ